MQHHSNLLPLKRKQDFRPLNYLSLTSRGPIRPPLGVATMNGARGRIGLACPFGLERNPQSLVKVHERCSNR